MINIPPKKECSPVVGSPAIYFGGLTGAFASGSVYFEAPEDGKL